MHRVLVRCVACRCATHRARHKSDDHTCRTARRRLADGGQIAPAHQYQNPNSPELGFFFLGNRAYCPVLSRKLADLAHRTTRPVLRLVLSLQAISLCTPRTRKRTEVRKALSSGPTRSTTYEWTNRTVLFQHWRARGNHNLVHPRLTVLIFTPFKQRYDPEPWTGSTGWHSQSAQQFVLARDRSAPVAVQSPVANFLNIFQAIPASHL